MPLQGEHDHELVDQWHFKFRNRMADLEEGAAEGWTKGQGPGDELRPGEAARDELMAQEEARMAAEQLQEADRLTFDDEGDDGDSADQQDS